MGGKRSAHAKGWRTWGRWGEGEWVVGAQTNEELMYSFGEKSKCKT